MLNKPLPFKTGLLFGRFIRGILDILWGFAPLMIWIFSGYLADTILSAPSGLGATSLRFLLLITIVFFTKPGAKWVEHHVGLAKRMVAFARKESSAAEKLKKSLQTQEK